MNWSIPNFLAWCIQMCIDTLPTFDIAYICLASVENVCNMLRNVCGWVHTCERHGGSPLWYVISHSWCSSSSSSTRCDDIDPTLIKVYVFLLYCRIVSWWWSSLADFRYVIANINWLRCILATPNHFTIQTTPVYCKLWLIS